jgi:integrase
VARACARVDSRLDNAKISSDRRVDADRPRLRAVFGTEKRFYTVWVMDAILTRPESGLFGTHSLRRTKATLIYRRTGNLRAVQLLLGHTKVESTVRYLGKEVDDALAIAEQVDV